MAAFGLLGEKLSHSFSPAIHALLGDYTYRLYEKPPAQVEAFLRAAEFDGLNVTIPYKKTVMPFCAALSETARRIGSVNTIVKQADGSLYGDNTDYYGFAYLLQGTGINPARGKTLVLGSGGSSVTVQAVLRDRRAAEVAVISREGENNYANLDKHRDALLIVNTTPVGMYPNNGVSPLPDLAAFPHLQGVIDLIYNPMRTELIQQAHERSLVGVSGLVMLVAQARKSAELFTGRPISEEKTADVLMKVGRQGLNLVLIGMPGCGKSSIGMALAEKTGRAFVDTDEWVTQAAGKSIPEIFSHDGEEAFRRLETQALEALCKRSGWVIATGGGVVTRPENRRVIRQNSTVIFLDRDVAELPLSDRPLSQRDGVAALAEARLPLYRQWADYAFAVRGVAETVADIYPRTKTSSKIFPCFREWATDSQDEK